MDHYQLSETQRRLHQLITLAEVVAVDATTARVKLDDGESVTDFIPYLAPRAGGVVVWSLPSVGEKCVLLAPDADWAHAIALPAMATAGGTETQHYVEFDDGARIAYDTATGLLEFVAINAVTITAPTINVVGNLNVNGTFSSTAGAIIAGKDFATHTHGGVETGSGTTGTVL
jgi:phage baseplate assembly protein V